MCTQGRLLQTSWECPEDTHGHAWCVLLAVGTLQTNLTCVSVYVSGVPGARICWKLQLFRDQVVIRYRVILVGWPPDIPFWNLSNEGGPTAEEMRYILRLLAADPPQLYFTWDTKEQLHMAQLTPGGLLPSTLHLECPALLNLGRSDIGR